MKEITPEYFEELVAQGIDRIPEKFLAKLRNVAVTVADEPTGEQLKSVGLKEENGETILGLYEGVSETDGGSSYRTFPDRITIFRRPILAEAGWSEDVPRLVEETVRHELAHHFGMSDEEIEERELNSDEGGLK